MGLLEQQAFSTGQWHMMELTVCHFKYIILEVPILNHSTLKFYYSVAGMATRLHATWSGVQIYVHPGSGPIQPPMQWVAGVQQFGHATDHSTPPKTQLKNNGATPLLAYMPSRHR